MSSNKKTPAEALAEDLRDTIMRHILDFVKDHPGASDGEVGSALNVELGLVMTMLDIAEEHGLVVSQPVQSRN